MKTKGKEGAGGRSLSNLPGQLLSACHRMCSRRLNDVRSIRGFIPPSVHIAMQQPYTHVLPKYLACAAQGSSASKISIQKVSLV